MAVYAVEDVDLGEYSSTVGWGGVQNYTGLWKSVCCFLRKLRTDLLQRPGRHLLSIKQKHTQSFHKGILSVMFTTALFLIVRIWKQSRYTTNIN